MKSSLRALAKLARQEVDVKRQALAAHEADLNALVEAKEAARLTQRDALEIAASTGEAMTLWAGIVEGGRRQSAMVEQHMTAQARSVEVARDQLMDSYIALRRLELLMERRQQQERRNAQIEEQAEQLERIALQRLAGC